VNPGFVAARSQPLFALIAAAAGDRSRGFVSLIFIEISRESSRFIGVGKP
jgi:hypothetical protein